MTVPSLFILTVPPVLAFVSSIARAEIQEFTNKGQWQAAAGTHETITFAEFPNQVITSQYADLGISFTDGLYFTFAADAFVNDGIGLGASLQTPPIILEFAVSMMSIGADHPGALRITLFYNGSLIHTSSLSGTSGTGHFIGLVSDIPFNRAVLLDPLGGTSIDDLHFGPPIPAPPACALALLGFAALVTRRRRSSP